MGVILDTSVLVGAERRAIDFERLLDSLGEESVGMAAITAAELLYGCERAADPGTRARRSAFVEAVLSLVPIRPFGLREARRHAELWAGLSREGPLIGPHDLIIAATALASGSGLATLNLREFGRVPGLKVISPDIS